MVVVVFVGGMLGLSTVKNFNYTDVCRFFLVEIIQHMRNSQELSVCFCRSWKIFG